MNELTPIVLLLILFSVGLTFCAKNETCSTWLYRSKEGWCTCGSSLVNVVVCDNQTQDVGILESFCLTTYNSGKNPNQAVVGSCLYGMNHGTPTRDEGAGLYVRVDRNISVQNERLCSYLNREGRLCGACKPGHYVSAYSYDLKCQQCRTGLAANVFAYVAVAYVPSTIFLLAVLFFRISFTSPRFTLVILLCQIYSLPVCLRVFTQYARGARTMIFFRFTSTVYGIWNLDFFRGVIPPICLPLDTIQVIALDYLTAAYPLLLLLCFYAIVTAHDRGCSSNVRLWKTCYHYTARIRQSWNIRNSITDAFATFIFISYMKFMYTSIDLLIFTHIVDIHGSKIGYVLYYDSTIDMLSSRHLPYAILAISVIVLGILFTLFLALYPNLWFQKLLNKWGLNNQGVRNFMDCFQGNYRNRTDGGAECRYFSAVYPLVRLVGSGMYAVTRSDVFFPSVILLFIIIIGTLAVARPYKNQYSIYNSVDILLWLSTMGFAAGIMMYSLSFDWYSEGPQCGAVIGMTFSLAPLVYFIVLLCKWNKAILMLKRMKQFLQKIKTNRSDYQDLDMEYPSSSSSLN